MSDNPPVTPGPGSPKEPLLSVGTITAVFSGAVAVAVSFGLNLSEAQQGSLLVFVGVIAPLAVALIGRSKVFAPATVRAMVKNAEVGGPTTSL
jgi:hypothetical protein